MQFPKTPKNPLDSLPIFIDPEDPYAFQVYLSLSFRNLAVSNSVHIENISKELLSWLFQRWWEAFNKALTEHNGKSKKCTVEVSTDVVTYTARIMAEMKRAKRFKIESVPESEELHEELKKQGLTPKAPIPKEQINPLKPAEILDTNVPQKERRKKPQL